MVPLSGGRMDTLPLILVMNRRRDVARWQQISTALHALDLPCHRIRAVDAQQHWALVRRCLPQSCCASALGRPLSPGEYGCALSHIAALRRVLRSQAPSAILLEDDATFDQRFKELVTEALPRFLRHCDIVKLEGLAYAYTSTSGARVAFSHGLDLIVPLRPPLGSAAYAVTQAGARRLLATFAALSDPLDHMLVAYERHRIPYAETRPFVVWQGVFPSTITRDPSALSGSRASPAPPLPRIRHQRLYRGLVRMGLAARVIARARLRTLFQW